MDVVVTEAVELHPLMGHHLMKAVTQPMLQLQDVLGDTHACLRWRRRCTHMQWVGGGERSRETFAVGGDGSSSNG